MKTKHWWSMVLGVTLIGVCVAPSCGQEKTAPPGIAVGEKAPEFKLKDQQGQERTLKDLIGSGDHQVLALVFFRSADW